MKSTKGARGKMDGSPSPLSLGRGVGRPNFFPLPFRNASFIVHTRFCNLVPRGRVHKEGNLSISVKYMK